MTRNRTGSSAVEFALLVGPLLLMIFATLEFGRFIWTRNAVQQTAIATARCMGIRQTACAIAGIVDLPKTVIFARTRASGYSVAVAATDVVANASASCANQTGFVSVTVTSRFRTTIPALRPYLGTLATISSSACFPNQV